MLDHEQTLICAASNLATLNAVEKVNTSNIRPASAIEMIVDSNSPHRRNDFEVRRYVFQISCVLFLIPLVAIDSRGQTATGSVFGSVQDPEGAVVIEATVRLTNTATNETRSTVSNNLGYYSFPLLPPGMYRLVAEKIGFKTHLRENMKVDVALNLAIDVMLELGQMSETILVNSVLPALEPGSSSLGHIIENQRITNLPLNGRNSYSFTTLVPGVRAARAFGAVATDMRSRSFVSINGSRPNQTAFHLDGGINVFLPTNGPGYFPSVDMVEEFKVQTNNFSAEFSNSGGGVINLVTKSGTNELHGTLYEFFRHDKLTANDFF